MKALGLGLGLGLGCGNGSSAAAFDPTAVSVELLERGDYSGGANVWTKTVGDDATSVTGTPPAASSGSPNFAGAEQLQIGLAGSYFTTALEWYVRIDPGTPGAAASMVNTYANDNIWSLRTNGNAGCSIQEDGGVYSCTFWIYNGAMQRAEVTLPNLNVRTVHGRYFWDGVSAGYVQVGIDGVWGTPTVIATAIDATYATDRIDLGRNYSASRFYTGLLTEFDLINAIQADAYAVAWAAHYA